MPGSETPKICIGNICGFLRSNINVDTVQQFVRTQPAKMDAVFAAPIQNIKEKEEDKTGSKRQGEELVRTKRAIQCASLLKMLRDPET